jgi:hypothetical protein
MNDLAQFFGNDLSISPTGDLAPVSGITRGQQRILRRLLTNPATVAQDGTTTQADYIWHPEYGAGLPQWIGRTVDIQKITAIIRGQILLEDSVAKKPAPMITVTPIANGLTCYIKYTDAQSNTPQSLSFNVKA